MTRFRSHPSTTDKLKEMKDQIIMAGTYLQISSPNSKSRLLRQLKLRIKDIQRIIDQANYDSGLSRRYAILLEEKKIHSTFLQTEIFLFPKLI